MEFKLTPETTVKEIAKVLVSEGYDTDEIKPKKVKEYYDKERLYWSSKEIVLVSEIGTIVKTFKPKALDTLATSGDVSIAKQLVEYEHSVPVRPGTEGWQNRKELI